MLIPADFAKAWKLDRNSMNSWDRLALIAPSPWSPSAVASPHDPSVCGMCKQPLNGEVPPEANDEELFNAFYAVTHLESIQDQIARLREKYRFVPK